MPLARDATMRPMSFKALPAGVEITPTRGRRFPLSRIGVFTLALSSFFAIAVILQHRCDAYNAELGGYPDEPGHFVTGVLFRDYFETFPPRPFIPFAEEFYIHRARIAIGHWPPVFYLIEGVWFCLFGVSRASAISLMGLICAATAASVWAILRSRCGEIAAGAAGLLFLSLGFVRIQSSEVMSDMLVALFGLWSAIAFADFLARDRLRDILLFSIFALLSIFTKNSGLYLAFLPPISILITRRLAVFRNPRLWLGAIAVGLPSLLWIVWSRKFAADYWIEKPGFALFVRAFPHNLVFLYMIFGPVFLLLALIGALRAWWRFANHSDLLPPVLAATAFSVLLFQSVAPLGLESRFFLPAVAAMIPLIFLGANWIATNSLSRVRPEIGVLAIVLAAALISPHQTFTAPPKERRGFSAVADLIQSEPALRKGATMVSSASDGEGILTAEVAMRYPCSEGYILRASKLLAHSDWEGRDYTSRFHSAATVSDYLERLGVGLVVIDQHKVTGVPEHQVLLLEAIRENPGKWRRVGVSASPKDSAVLTYQRTAAIEGPERNIRNDMREVLQRILHESE